MRRRIFGRKLGLAAIGLLIASGMMWGTRAEAQALTCTLAALQAVEPAGTTITAVVAQPAVAPLPDYCQVNGYVTTTNPGPNQVNFELVLPDLAVWNGKFLFFGNGGFAGSIQTNPVDGITAGGYATAATDTGHQAGALDGSWALDNQAKVDDFGYRGVHVTAQASEALALSYYGSPLGHRYFYGCSDGGREAMVEAQQYPTDFDGVVAGDPAIGSLIAGFNHNYTKALFKTPDSWIPPTKMPLIDAAVLNNCDGKDGVIDGLIQDPRKCTFQPSSLLCPSGDSNPDSDPTCLSRGQVAALNSIYDGTKSPNGGVLYPGYTESDPAGVDGWSLWISGFVQPTSGPEPWGNPPASFATAPLQWSFQDQYMKYFVFDSASFDSLGFEINDPSEFMALEQSVTTGGGSGTGGPNAENKLDGFRAAGDKLLLYHGWSDPALTPLKTLNYYNAMASGLNGGVTHARKFARLFFVPGMHHCGGGPGPNVFDPLTPLDAWVTTGTAPDGIIAYHFENNDPTTGVVTRSMPLCAYPEQAKYLGGDVNSASSWTCPSKD